MKLIIEIPEKNFIKDDLIHFFGCYSQKLDEVIRNGTPLPKGHGDLIDRKNLLQLESMWYHLRNGDVACPKIDIENAPTIIEADKESE